MILGIIGNCIEILIVRYQLLKVFQRPFPEQAKGLGIFNTMNLAISVLAIFSNVGIVCFTSKSFGDEK